MTPVLRYFKNSYRKKNTVKLFCTCGAPVMMLLMSVSEKQRTNISTDRSGMAPKCGTEIGVLIRYIPVP